MNDLDLMQERKYKIISSDTTENVKDRNNYARDRARIIHSASFRRLQGKTQVLGLGESDFYRTRLTHSIEVAQIASGILEHLKNSYPQYQEYMPEQNLIEAIGLAHDIGHPPFGHGGEYALNYCMSSFGGFEGNAQTLRICTKLGEYSENDGLNLTRRTLLGLIKYPVCYSNAVNTRIYNIEKAPLKLDSFKPPKFNFFDCDEEHFNWIMRPFSETDFNKFKSMGVTTEHGKTKYKNFDCSIMELADDIAYGVHDLEDAIALEFITEKNWIKHWEDSLQKEWKDLENNLGFNYEKGNLTTDLFSGRNRTRKKAISYLVGYFIRECKIEEPKTFNEKVLDLKAILSNKTTKQKLEILKKCIVNFVINKPEVQTLEYKGQQMIIRLFDALANNPKMLERKHYERYKSESNESKQLRVICDYIAGTTDDYATRLYHKIFTPSSGSIFDKL